MFASLSLSFIINSNPKNEEYCIFIILSSHNILLPLYLGLIVEDMKGRLNPAHVPFGETRELYGETAGKKDIILLEFYYLYISFMAGLVPANRFLVDCVVIKIII